MAALKDELFALQKSVGDDPKDIGDNPRTGNPTLDKLEAERAAARRATSN